MMVRVARAYAFPTFAPAQVVKAPVFTKYGRQTILTLQPDERWTAGERLPDGAYVITNVEREGSEPPPSIRLLPDGRVSGWVRVDAQGAWPDSARFVRLDDPVLVEGSFEAELVYSGLDGATLRLLYREYYDGLARPAFTQDLTYNLDESKTIEFKSLKIDILEATNSLIRFRVTDDGGLPWLPDR